MTNPIAIVAAAGAQAEDLIVAAEDQLRVVRDQVAGGGPDSADCDPSAFLIDVTDAATTPAKVEYVRVGAVVGHCVEFEAQRTDMYLKDGRLWFKYEVQQ